ncbi:MAG: protein translocase subunit SecF [Firmicutes bacterium]|nr:protein translocase subunit SecF [Bacillota bacterium]
MKIKNMRIVENRKKFFTVSIILIAVGLAAMIVNAFSGRGALNFDVDFTGGTAMTIDIGSEFDNNTVLEVIAEVTGQKSPQVQKILGTNQVSIKIQSIDGETRTALINAITEKFGIGNDNVLSVSDISGTVSGEMQKAAVIAVLIACAVMLVYISIRFSDFRMGISSIIALVHDVLIMISFYAVFRIPVNNAFIAALLTVLGYSINATIVIFDRIRENRGSAVKEGIPSVVDRSVKQTMRRSLYTSITTLVAIVPLYLIGVEAVKEFALPIMVGIISGGYSSIFLSGSIWYMLTKKMKDLPDPRDYYDYANE